MAKGQCLDQGFQPTFRGHCSWGAGEQEEAPCLFCLMHVVPLGELVCQCMSYSMHGGCATTGTVLLHTRVHAELLGVQCVRSPCACAHPKHAQLLCARSLHTHHTHPVQAQHTLFAHSLQAPRMQRCSQHCRFTLVHALSTLSCSLRAHSFHTHHARSVCASCKHCTHPLCSPSLHTRHVLCACPVQMLCACSLPTLPAHSAQALSAWTLCMFAHTGRAGTLTKAMQAQWTICTHHKHSVHTLQP